MIALVVALWIQDTASSPQAEPEAYRIESFATNDDIVLEVGGLAMLSDGRPVVSTRRGEVWIVDGAYEEDLSAARFTRFADGLHEPLGLLVEDDWIYTVQRGELSRMRDTNGDDRIDQLETLCDTWSISGNYHEYNFGPRRDDDGYLWITTNKPFGDEPFGRAPWRGFAIRVGPDGSMLPTCAGLRSPAGIEKSPWGDMFYTDNQGEWCGASKLAHLEPGDFHGHPWGLPSTQLAEWTYGPVAEPPNGTPMHRVGASVPNFKLPAVWFPYSKVGKSPAGMVWDRTDGGFGPFAGQLLVADQFDAAVFRVFLERVNGHWQGACFRFLDGFRSGALRLAWGRDDSLFVGCTNRGWGSLGSSTEGLERVRWSGRVPFEIHSMSARHNGFELAFTHAVDESTATKLSNFRIESYTYLLHESYGSPEVDRAEVEVIAATLGPQKRSIRLTLDGMRAGFVHELHAPGLRSQGGSPLVHSAAYYTLIEIPRR